MILSCSTSIPIFEAVDEILCCGVFSRVVYKVGSGVFQLPSVFFISVSESAMLYFNLMSAMVFCTRLKRRSNWERRRFLLVRMVLLSKAC